MSCEGPDDQEGLIRVHLDPLFKFGSGFENFRVTWSVIEEIFIFPPIICNSVPCAHNSYLFNVSSTFQELIDAVLHRDPAPLALVHDIVQLFLHLLPAGIVDDRRVPDEAGVVSNVRVVLDLVFQCLRLHLNL